MQGFCLGRSRLESRPFANAGSLRLQITLRNFIIRCVISSTAIGETTLCVPRFSPTLTFFTTIPLSTTLHMS